jgi:phosphoenolpyruvate-protein kinase (PTS system EI component)
MSGEASAKAAAQEMKVKLDAMRDELAAERSRNQDLLDVVEKLVKLLRGTQASADQLDDVADGYSNALTQLLTPDTPA